MYHFTYFLYWLIWALECMCRFFQLQPLRGVATARQSYLCRLKSTTFALCLVREEKRENERKFSKINMGFTSSSFFFNLNIFLFFSSFSFSSPLPNRPLRVLKSPISIINSQVVESTPVHVKKLTTKCLSEFFFLIKYNVIKLLLNFVFISSLVTMHLFLL